MTSDGGTDAAADDAAHDAAGAEPGRGADGFDLKGIVRQLTAPMLDSLDSRLREQIEQHVDELLTQKLDAALASRMATIDRAIADLSRAVDALERRLDAADEHG